MSLTVLSVAYPLAPVSEDAAGGAEQILSAIDRALVQKGHRSLVVGGSSSGPPAQRAPAFAFLGFLISHRSLST